MKKKTITCVECGRIQPHAARGLCSACYFRLRKSGSPLPAPIRRRRPFGRTVTRSLKPGEAVPGSAPRRYPHSAGYVRLRWTVSPGQQVETYEHRVVDGYVTADEHVHHENRVRNDNRPENLVGLTAEEHAAEHHEESRARAQKMAQMYREGYTTVALARTYGLNNATVYRQLTGLGVKMRSQIDYAVVLDAEEVAELYRLGRSVTSLARQFRVETGRMTRAIKSTGTKMRRPGRPKNHSVMAENSARLLVRKRSGGVCEVCGQAAATNFHHRKNRSQGGGWSAWNGLDVCGSGTTGCHGRIGAGPTVAYQQGWLVHREHDPVKSPVWLAGHGYCFLNADGSITETEEEVVA